MIKVLARKNQNERGGRQKAKVDMGFGIGDDEDKDEASGKLWTGIRRKRGLWGDEGQCQSRPV